MKTPANLLTGAILEYIRATGGHSERVNNISRTVKNKYGKDIHIPSANMKGTADIHACKKGKFVACEIKIAKDRQSDAQLYYQESVERAGGEYLIVKDFDDFMRQWGQI